MGSILQVYAYALSHSLLSQTTYSYAFSVDEGVLLAWPNRGWVFFMVFAPLQLFLGFSEGCDSTPITFWFF